MKLLNGKNVLAQVRNVTSYHQVMPVENVLYCTSNVQGTAFFKKPLHFLMYRDWTVHTSSGLHKL
jgi:hypothetical protein